MIHESSYWKEPLLEAAQRLRVLTTPGELSEEQLAEVERDLFIGFYAIRKLLDAPQKLTDATRAVNVDLKWHAAKGAPSVTWRNNQKIGELYDLGKAHDMSKPVRFICNQIIHSLVFIPCEQEHGGLSGVFFASDDHSNSRLYFIHVTKIIEIFERIGRDYPTSIKWERDPDTGKETLEVK